MYAAAYKFLKYARALKSGIISASHHTKALPAKQEAIDGEC
jgi:hypothetical protein